jgi:hypothetical protein
MHIADVTSLFRPYVKFVMEEIGGVQPAAGINVLYFKNIYI